MGDLDLFLHIVQVKGHACLISNRYIKHRSKELLELQCRSLYHCVSGEYRGKVEIYATLTYFNDNG